MSSRTNIHRMVAAKKHKNIRQDIRRMPDNRTERLMHELKAVQSLVEELMIMEPRPKKVKVRLGRMNANPLTFLQMFREFTSKSGLSGIKIEIEEVPVLAKCKCGFYGGVPVTEHVHFVRCPDCKKIADIIQGNEMEIVE